MRFLIGEVGLGGVWGSLPGLGGVLGTRPGPISGSLGAPPGGGILGLWSFFGVTGDSNLCADFFPFPLVPRWILFYWTPRILTNPGAFFGPFLRLNGNIGGGWYLILFGEPFGGCCGGVVVRGKIHY